jgi:hypothetical protein
MSQNNRNRGLPAGRAGAARSKGKASDRAGSLPKSPETGSRRAYLPPRGEGGSDGRPPASGASPDEAARLDGIVEGLAKSYRIDDRLRLRRAVETAGLVFYFAQIDDGAHADNGLEDLPPRLSFDEFDEIVESIAEAVRRLSSTMPPPLSPERAAALGGRFFEEALPGLDYALKVLEAISRERPEARGRKQRIAPDMREAVEVLARFWRRLTGAFVPSWDRQRSGGKQVVVMEDGEPSPSNDAAGFIFDAIKKLAPGRAGEVRGAAKAAYDALRKETRRPRVSK